MSLDDFQARAKKALGDIQSLASEASRARRRTANIERERQQWQRKTGLRDARGDKRTQELERLAGAAAGKAEESRRRYTESLQDAWNTLREFESFTDPVRNVHAWEDDCPILMLPLRLETRFKRVENGATELWVRVFPDDIAVNTFEGDLSEAERRNARSYWQARWKAGKDLAGNRGAWRSLAAAHGPGRAWWLVQNYVPVNAGDEPERGAGEIILAIGTDAPLDEIESAACRDYWASVWKSEKDGEKLDHAWSVLVDRIGEARAEAIAGHYRPFNLPDPPPPGLGREDTTVRVEFVVFPAQDELDAKMQGWSLPPTSVVLPERFVLVGFRGGKQDLGPALGALIPPRLILGPDPAADEGEDFRPAGTEEAGDTPHAGDLVFSESLRWLFDFNEAVDKGMGFKVPLTAEQAREGFDQLFVVGLKLGADRTAGKRLLEELFAQHQSSRKGLALVRQGTPTNNTEAAASGYSWRHDPDDSFATLFGDADRDDPDDWRDKRDGRWLADILGVDADRLRTVENYYGTDVREALAMQRALWPATLGHFMQSMLHPVFEPDDVERAREFFTRYVIGRGTLPVLRVGKQPYGILPATRFTQMRWFLPERDDRLVTTHLPRSNFLARLYRVLVDLDRIWTSLTGRVAFVGKSGDPHQVLLDIIGLHPDSAELQKRYANTVKQLHNIYNLLGYPHLGLFSHYSNSYASAAALLARHGYVIGGGNPEPEILKKSFFNEAWPLRGHRIDEVPSSETAPLGVSTEDGRNYLQWLVDAAEQSHDALRRQEGFIDGKKPTALLYLLLHHALDLSYIDTSLKLHASKGVLPPSGARQGYVEPDFIHIEDQPTESRWKYLYVNESRITGSSDTMVQAYIPTLPDTAEEARGFRDALSGIKRLRDLPTARLERLMMEHLDTVSYRYDAWMSGLVAAQLERMRQSPPAAGEDGQAGGLKQGIYLGAYGWLEDLRPRNRPLSPVELPDELREHFTYDDNLVSDSSNAGYILAPSQNHAVTSAVLRNAHLSRGNDTGSERFRIKLTSERVRLALQVIEGIQAGQSLAALLGYRFERGLHDRTDAEVDSFIFELRNRFPLMAKRLKDTAPPPGDPDYESIEQIEAKNVIDGVALLEHIRESGNASYPFSLPLPAASVAQRQAIDAEVRALIGLNDAVADLAVAESVHQVVMGNYERANATLETYSKGKSPPTPDVIKTPRSGFQLTHRVGLQFRAGLSFAPGDPGVTPRMVAEPAMHDWLQNVLPAPADIGCVADYVDATTRNPTRAPVTMANLGLAAIDLLYLLDADSEQAMTALDDLVVHYVRTSLAPVVEEGVSISYTETLDSAQVPVFAVSALVASLRHLLLSSRPLMPTDVKRANEAAKADEAGMSVDSTRLTALLPELASIRSGALAAWIGDAQALIAAGDARAIAAQLDALIAGFTGILVRAAAYGVTQAGSAFTLQWEQGLYAALRSKLDALSARWEQRRADYESLRSTYLDAVTAGAPDDELFLILARAELKIASADTRLAHASPADYFNAVDTVQRPAFETLLDTALPAARKTEGLSALFAAIFALETQAADFDTVEVDVGAELAAVAAFVDDLLSRAQELSDEMEKREGDAAALLAAAAAEADAPARVEAVRKAAKAVFGQDFVIVPEFTLGAGQAAEWQNTVTGSGHSLRYLTGDLDMDFPMDDWLYGIARVREKMAHLENATVHVEGLTNRTLALTPSQFPYRVDDLWLGLQFPEEKPGTGEPFSLDEDKLLYTAIYTGGFDAAQPQCGLLLDEWSEVIPSRTETLGLAFHYDQPNSEPPQTLLLLTPSEFTGRWRWEDIVETLRETLAMAKKRAVEPDHLDTTVLGRFLPPVVSLSSPEPLTAVLNLALNNLAVTQVSDNE